MKLKEFETTGGEKLWLNIESIIRIMKTNNPNVLKIITMEVIEGGESKRIHVKATMQDFEEFIYRT